MNIVRAEFESTLLCHCLGKSFDENNFVIAKLSSILMDLNQPRSKDNLTILPILEKCLETKINTWKKNSSDKWVKELLTRLSEDAESLWIDLTLFSLLYSYPRKLLEFVIPANRIPLLLEIPPNAITELPLNAVATEQALSQIELYFNDVSPTVRSSDDLKTLLYNVSGRLKEELKFILNILDRKQFDVSSDDVEIIKQKFKTCPGVNQSKLLALARYVKVARPATIEENRDWDAGQWQQWAIEQYMPYRDWQVLNNVNDPEVEKTVQKFSSWYIEEYPVHPLRQ